MSQQKNTNDLLNMDETISNSEEFLTKNKNLIFGSYRGWIHGIYKLCI